MLRASLVLLITLVAGSAAAQEDEPADPADVARVDSLCNDLASDDATVRRTAYDSLTGLDADMLPAIRDRIERLSRGRPERNWATDILNRFRRRSNGDEGESTDVSLGALEELGQEHPHAGEHDKVLKMAEAAILWRALDEIGTLEAQQAVYPLVALDEGLWLPEARNWVRERGPALTAAAIAGRNHDDRFVRRWARWAVEHLGADDPGRTVQQLPDEQLADVLRAYAGLRMQSAMRVIVSYVDSDRRRIRHAARWAMEQYGGNAIWILRTAYRNETGEHAPQAWGWRRLTGELFAVVDARRLAPVRAALDEGLAALERGDLDAMKARFDDVLARAPELEEPDPVAEGYAALAARRLAERQHAEAANAYRRALRLAPDSERAAGWRSQLSFAEAQAMRARGVLDVDAYGRVLEVAPEHEGALEALAAAEPPAVIAARRDEQRTHWGLAAAGLLGLLGIALLWPTRRAADETIEREPTCETTLDAPTLDDPADATLADQTLPG